jgi:type IV secretion system protein VirB4
MSTAEPAFSKYMPLINHVTQHVVLLSDGSAMALFEVDGLPQHTADDALLYRTRGQLNHDLTGLSSEPGIVLYNWVTRGFASPSLYPAPTFRSDYARELDRRYRDRLFNRFLYLNRTYVGVLLLPPQPAGKRLSRWWRALFPHDVDSEPPRDRITRLNRICEIIETNLAPYKPRRLGLRREDGRVFTEIGEAMAFVMTGVWRPVGLQANNRIGTLLSERLIFLNETIEIRGPGHSSWAASFGAKQMPVSCPPGTLDSFLTAPFRSTLMQSFRLIPVQSALSLMTRQQNWMVNGQDKAASQAASLTTAMDLVQSGRMAMGDHHLVATVFTDDLAAMPTVAKDAWRTLQRAGFQVAREDRALQAAWLSMLPGNAYLRPRPGVVSTFNYASLAGMHAFPAGDERGRWGAPIAIFRTTAGTPYRYHFHINGVANTFIFGETGSGKSAWLAFIMTQAERSNVQLILFDKDRGLEIVCRALGGRYLALDHPTGLSWLKAYENTPDDIHQLARLIRGLIASTDAYHMTPEENRRLFIGLTGIMALPPAERWLTDLRAFLGVSRDGAAARLERFCWGQEYGWICDCPDDIVQLDAPVLGFDVTRFLDDPIVCGPVMADLLYRTGKLADGRRLLTIVDESWKATDIPAFAEDVRDGLKTDRKKNAGVILATQSVSDALNGSIGSTIREQMKTVIAFAVERPDRADFRRLRYTERECDIIEDLRPGTGQFLLRQGNRSVVLQLPLAGMNDDLAVLSGNEVNVRVLDQVRGDDVDPDPVKLIEDFHTARKAAEVEA